MQLASPEFRNSLHALQVAFRLYFQMGFQLFRALIGLIVKMESLMMCLTDRFSISLEVKRNFCKILEAPKTHNLQHKFVMKINYSLIGF